MPARVLPTLWSDAQLADVVTVVNQLSILLSELLMVNERGGLDKSNIQRRGIYLGTGSGVAGNIDGVYVAYTSNAVADTEDTVTHNLGRIPVGYIVVDRDKAGIVYSSSKNTWTTTTMKLKCNVASTASTLLVF